MNVLIVGAGAMGGLLGARLSRAATGLHLLDSDRRLVTAVRRAGLEVEELDGGRTRAEPAITDRIEEVPAPIDLVVVMVKAAATHGAVASVLGRCHEQTLFLTLQNGIGHGPAIAALVGDARLLLGTTAQGATLLEPGRIRHGGNGTTHIGCLASAAVADARRVVDLFNRAGLQAFFSERIEDRIWQKLLINIGINAVTALTAIPNGRVASQANARALAERAVAEALAVAERLGIQVGERVLEQMLAVAEATGTNRSSMLQDLERKRATEIDAINGAIVRYGEDLGIPTPVNWTLTQLIKVIEHRQASEGDS